jgi:hypothetical protein
MRERDVEMRRLPRQVILSIRDDAARRDPYTFFLESESETTRRISMRVHSLAASKRARHA